MRVQAHTTFVIPRETAIDWEREELKLLELTKINDENFDPPDGEPKFAYDGRIADLGVLIDMGAVLDTAATSAEITAVLRALVAQDRVLKRGYTKGLASNPVVDGRSTNDYCLMTTAFSAQLKEMPVVARVINFVQGKTQLRVRNASLNVYSPGRKQLKHRDWTDKTARIVVPFAPEGSSRIFEITDRTGQVLWSHLIKHGEWIAILMEGDSRGDIYKYMHWGCKHLTGNHGSLILTFEDDLGAAALAALTRDRPTPQAWQHRLGKDFADELAEIVRDGPDKPQHPFSSG